MSELNFESADDPLHDFCDAQDVIESLLARLKVLQVALQPIQPIQPIPAESAVAIQQQVVRLQQHFQQLVAMLAAADLNGDQRQRLRPYQTEAHRLLRLMGVVALKLQAAKRIETWDQQRSHLIIQLNQLQAFAQAIADEIYRWPSDSLSDGPSAAGL